MLGSSLCLTGFLQVLLQLICLLGPAKEGGDSQFHQSDGWRKESPLPHYPPGEEGRGLTLRMAPDVANKASGWGDIYVKIRPSKARTTFLRTVQCDGKSKPGEQGSQWAGVKFKSLELVERERWGRGQQLPLLHFWVSVGWAKVQYSGSKGLYWITKGRM